MNEIMQGSLALGVLVGLSVGFAIAATRRPATPIVPNPAATGETQVGETTGRDRVTPHPRDPIPQAVQRLTYRGVPYIRLR